MTPPAPEPADEARRLASLCSLQVLDSEPEAVFEQITALAAELCGVPISLVSLVAADRQWFKANVGLPGVAETSRDLAFCSHAIQSDSVLEVADASQDPRFADNPLVTGEPGIRFYAGAPLVMPGGDRLGTLCVIDRAPRRLQGWQRQALAGLAALVVTTLVERQHRLALSEELALAQADYRGIVEGQGELISLATEDGTLGYVNPAYAQFFGRDAAGLVGGSLFDLVAERDHAAVRTHLRRVFSEGQVAADANRMRAADGQERWVAWSNRCIPARDGRPRMIHSVGRDITDQRRAEQALADNEQRSRRLYRSTPALLHSIDPQGRLIEVSDAWLQHLGYQRDEVIGRPSAAFLSAASAEHARNTVLPEFFRTGRCDDVAYQMLRQDGSMIDVLLSAVLETDGEGRPLRSLAVLQDVTERNRVSASLHETTHMLQLVLDGLPARISYWGLDNRNRFANKAFLEWYGVEQQAIVGRHAREVLGEATFARIERPIAAGLAGQPRQIEAVAPGPDGRDRVIDMRFIPDQHDGQVHGLFVLALDITAQRQAERELAEQQRRQQAAAEQALREKETLLKEVYHRVKNNLQVVQSLLNLQRSALPPGAAREAMQDSAQRVRAMALVHEKLYQSGNLAAISLPAYTGELLEQIADAHGGDRTRVTIEVDIAGIETGLDAAVPYGLLLTELVSNSFKHAFAPGAGGTIRVSLVRRPDGDLLTVADDGAGYPTGKATGEVDSAPRSATMGLQLADSLARQLGGELRTRSGGGATSTALLTRL